MLMFQWNMDNTLVQLQTTDLQLKVNNEIKLVPCQGAGVQVTIYFFFTLIL